ncbi:DUF302 domain-containing protein [Psychromonas antarctica]|uniref:DUF302 domain-containing protein n=1 Tax=Psychromonas antarctica TaxID=67573 RepID=UPI001EE83B15|nr:DUF302 domain-containing protein [Psychromonas antarctica]MCG6201042.1 DUF302 domain-containing protein [Psychromonas antarctica]
MKKAIIVVWSILLIAIPTVAAEGVVDIQSAFTVKETTDRMVDILNKKGMTIFARIKHSESAAKVGIKIRNTELIIFGNPKVGSPLMACEQSVAIDLPQKALIWEDANDHVWISYNDPRYLEKKHNITGCEGAIVKIENALSKMTKAAATE